MSKAYIIPSLQRGVRIIEAVIAEENGLTPMELEEKFGIPKTTIFRILYTLQNENWLKKQGERYIAGHRLVQSGMQALSGMELRSISLPYLDKLSKETGETSHLGVWAGKQVMLAEVCDGPKHIRVANRAGSLAPAYSSSLGKILLAYDVGSAHIKDFFKGEKLEQWTSNTRTELDDLAADLDRVVERGYSVDDRECHENVRCIAAPVRNGSGKVIAGIGVTATTLTLQEELIPEIAQKVMDIANEISHALGAR